MCHMALGIKILIPFSVLSFNVAVLPKMQKPPRDGRRREIQSLYFQYGRLGMAAVTFQ